MAKQRELVVAWKWFNVLLLNEKFLKLAQNCLPHVAEHNVSKTIAWSRPHTCSRHLCNVLRQDRLVGSLVLLEEARECHVGLLGACAACASHERAVHR